uniref:DOD-type homing endonuclease domain-containing protein n=1 Tax=viral metagenome TaxID=1070528 RepID=A0A6C0B6C3_9ZZZZ
MNQPFNPTEKLVLKPEAKGPLQLRYRIHEKAPIVEDGEEPQTILQEVSDDVPQKQIIKDKRKISNVDRTLIYNRLRQNNLNAVVGKTEYEPVKRTIVPVGTVKLDKTVVLIDDDKTVQVEVEANEPVNTDEIEQEIKHVEQLLDQAVNLDKEPVPSEIKLEEIPKKIKRPRKLKVIPGQEQELVNIDLTTAKIRDQLVSERLPLSSDKVIVKASAYYMNNREISVSKLNELFRPYRKDITSDEQSLSCESRSAGAELDLLTHQKIVRDYLNLYTPYRGLLLYHGLGSGKCHAKGTPIMLSDGSTKLVEDIQVGDFLMGDDSKPRTVLSLARGRDKMYDIIPVKGEKYTVNQEHILCLRATGFPKMSFNNHSFNVQWLENNKFQSRTFSYDLNNLEEKRKEAEAFFENVKATDNVFEIAVKDYLELSDKKKGFLKGYRTAVDFPEKELPIDPYMIGYWLGDDASNGCKITSQDSTVLYYFSKQLPKYGLTLNYYCQYDYGISGDGRYNNNVFLNTLKENNMINNKHIPMIYKCNSRENRLRLLAGLLDSDGHYSSGGFDFTQKNERLMNDVVYLARSLGFSCYKSEKKTSWTYKGEKKEGKAYRMTINGNGLEEIPTLIPRKRASPRNQIKDVLVTGIKAKYVGLDDYYGFMLDGNSRYVLGDFTVTHNTATSISIAEGMKSEKKIFVLTPASLKMNFFSELKRFGDQLYRKNQFWEFISIEGRPEYVSILSKALSLPVEYIRSGGGAWLVNIEKEPNFTEKTAEEQNQIDDQLNMMIRAKYVDINYNGLTQKVFNNLTANGSKNPFDNAVVLIDEAHNFVSRIVNKIKKPTSISHKLYHYLMDATNARVVFMTGTPIINYPNEIGILFNMLRGFIKTWTMTVNVKTTNQVNTASILAAFNKENFRSFDYIEYSGNKLTITRNPFGFINTKKRGVVKGTARAKKEGGGLLDLFKGARTTKKRKPSVKPQIGGAGEFEKYNGVKLDDSGNLSDHDFQDRVMYILSKNGLEVNKGSIEIQKNKALPDDSQAFLDIFVNSESVEVKNMDLFQRRILGLTSYFRSAQEKLLPTIEKTVENDIFHVVRSEMSGHQFSEYQRIRKSEAEQEKRNRKNKKKAGPDNEDLFKISSTYRIFSRSACNFVFPPGMQRPMPSGKEDEVDENAINATPTELLEQEDEYLEAQDVEEKKAKESGSVEYQKQIRSALDALRYNNDAPREKEYLLKSELGLYSPKFVKVLENLQAEENQGLHLIYSQFRTIEGIGILKLILEANGFAEFKIKKVGDEWTIDEKETDASKPRFVLYTGTEGAEEKEIVRNIYNSTWDFVPPNIAMKLRERNENNNMGEVIKIFMITSSGAEGINLRNTRFVHIIEPYWHMVRIEQVIGRARRICSHQDLPEELRTVKVFLYLAVLTQEQKTSEDNIELTNRDTSRLDNQTPVTTDESMLEIASMKDKVNRQILKSVKQSAMDCSLYSSKNKDEPLVCYNYGVVESNQFGSVPSFENDRGKKEPKLNKQEVEWEAEEITYREKKYALNRDTNELFDLDSYLQSQETGAQPILLGNLIKTKTGFTVKLLDA